MAGMIHLTAATLKAMLCYIDAEKTPKVAYDRDDMAIPLIEKVKHALGDSDGSQSVWISFRDDEKELERQFLGVCEKIGEIFTDVAQMGKI